MCSGSHSNDDDDDSSRTSHSSISLLTSKVSSPIHPSKIGRRVLMAEREEGESGADVVVRESLFSSTTRHRRRKRLEDKKLHHFIFTEQVSGTMGG